jgi:hypothetical protein
VTINNSLFDMATHGYIVPALSRKAKFIGSPPSAYQHPALRLLAGVANVQR